VTITAPSRASGDDHSTFENFRWRRRSIELRREQAVTDPGYRCRFVLDCVPDGTGGDCIGRLIVKTR
jgi:hypothetical protein